jgi:hypothetical protein
MNRVGRTLLSVAFDLDLDVDLDFDRKGHGFIRAAKQSFERARLKPGRKADSKGMSFEPG